MKKSLRDIGREAIRRDRPGYFPREFEFLYGPLHLQTRMVTSPGSPMVWREPQPPEHVILGQIPQAIISQMNPIQLHVYEFKQLHDAKHNWIWWGYVLAGEWQ